MIGPGTFTVGGVVSWTVTVNEAPAEFPESSVAVQLTVVGPIGNRLPEGGAQTTVGLASTRSDADAENVTTAPPGPVAGAVMFPGTVIGRRAGVLRSPRKCSNPCCRGSRSRCT